MLSIEILTGQCLCCTPARCVQPPPLVRDSLESNSLRKRLGSSSYSSSSSRRQLCCCGGLWLGVITLASQRLQLWS